MVLYFADTIADATPAFDKLTETLNKEGTKQTNVQPQIKFKKNRRHCINPV